jgi:hypothetical protein
MKENRWRVPENRVLMGMSKYRREGVRGEWENCVMKYFTMCNLD